MNIRNWRNGTKLAAIASLLIALILIGWDLVPGDPAPTWYSLPAAVLIPFLICAAAFGIMPALFDAGLLKQLTRFMDWIDR